MWSFFPSSYPLLNFNILSWEKSLLDWSNVWPYKWKLLSATSPSNCILLVVHCLLCFAFEGLAKRRHKKSQVELAYKLALNGKTYSQVYSQGCALQKSRFEATGVVPHDQNVTNDMQVTASASYRKSTQVLTRDAFGHLTAGFTLQHRHYLLITSFLFFIIKNSTQVCLHCRVISYFILLLFSQYQSPKLKTCWLERIVLIVKIGNSAK